MRVKLSRSQSYVPEFNDNKQLPAEEQIRADLNPLKMGDFLDLADYLQQVGQGNQVDTKNLSVSKMKSLLSNGSALLVNYAVLHGLVDDATGQPVTINEVATQPSFIPLAVELLVQLAAVSSPTEDDVKN